MTLHILSLFRSNWATECCCAETRKRYVQTQGKIINHGHFGMFKLDVVLNIFKNSFDLSLYQLK